MRERQGRTRLKRLTSMAVNLTGSFLLQGILNEILFTSKSFPASQTTDLYYALSPLSSRSSSRSDPPQDLSEYSVGRKLTSPQSCRPFFALDYDPLSAGFSEQGNLFSPFDTLLTVLPVMTSFQVSLMSFASSLDHWGGTQLLKLYVARNNFVQGDSVRITMTIID